MIGRIRGLLLEKSAPNLLVDVNGVGYEIDAPMSTIYELPEPGIGAEIVLHTHLVVREDQHTLYGFATYGERAFFRSLIRVNGVGAKLALAILSGINASTFSQCVLAQDTATLTKLPGVGKKTAERLIIEMQDRVENWAHIDSNVERTTCVSSPGKSSNAIEDAVSALIALGYKPPEASRMVRNIDNTEALASDEIIRIALQQAVST